MGHSWQSIVWATTTCMRTSQLKQLLCTAGMTIVEAASQGGVSWLLTMRKLLSSRGPLQRSSCWRVCRASWAGHRAAWPYRSMSLPVLSSEGMSQFSGPPRVTACPAAAPARPGRGAQPGAGRWPRGRYRPAERRGGGGARVRDGAAHRAGARGSTPAQAPPAGAWPVAALALTFCSTTLSPPLSTAACPGAVPCAPCSWQTWWRGCLRSVPGWRRWGALRRRGRAAGASATTPRRWWATWRRRCGTLASGVASPADGPPMLQYIP